MVGSTSLKKKSSHELPENCFEYTNTTIETDKLGTNE